MADDTEATLDLDDFIYKRNVDPIGNSLIPRLFEDITQERATQTVVHRILRRPSPEISFGVSETRTGTMTMLFTNRDQDFAGYLTGHNVFTLRSYSDSKLNEMSFVLTGPLRIDLDDGTRKLWHVSFDYTEVL